MFKMETRRTIERPVEEVFAFMSDAENDALWRTNVKEIKRVSGGDHSKVGSEYRQKLKGPFGGFVADLRYTEYEPNKRIAFETIKGSVDPTASIEFAAKGEAQSEVHFQLQWEPRGAMKLMAPLLGKTLRSNMEASYDNLVRMLNSREDEALARAPA